MRGRTRNVMIITM